MQTLYNPLSDGCSLIVETARRKKAPIQLDVDIAPEMLWVNLLYDASLDGYEYKWKWQEYNPNNSRNVSRIENIAKQKYEGVFTKYSIRLTNSI